ncbi:hypothetical protein AAHA92_25206 [Salvia divinorum]|uniref:Uncharacterized protein n=1 Tax=Salvia divinorum TaxID=28513 RepID=A0ABD1GCH5_SALDI
MEVHNGLVDWPGKLVVRQRDFLQASQGVKVAWQWTREGVGACSENLKSVDGDGESVDEWAGEGVEAQVESEEGRRPERWCGRGLCGLGKEGYALPMTAIGGGRPVEGSGLGRDE